jgi:hypothetical protein
MRRIDLIYAAMAKWQERPFVYGESDCCLFVNHVYSRVDRNDFISYPYKGKAEADILLARYGSLSSVVNFALANCHVGPEWLRLGDLALWTRQGREGLGIVVSTTEVVTVRYPDGKLTILPFECVEHGWRMGPI